MAEWVDTAIKVSKIKDGKIEVQVGPEGFEWDIAELEELATGKDVSETLKRNIAIALRLSGTELSNAATLKTAMESRFFKYLR